MISINKLEFSYPDGEFRMSIDQLEIEQGSTVAIVGPSGTGKTTLLDLIAGNKVPNSGEVRVADEEISRMGDQQRRNFRICNIGFVFQEFELIEYLAVLDNILLPYRVTSALNLDQEVRARAASLADELGVGDKLKRNVKHLSKGEQQRVAICRALLTEPSLLLCDEPTGNLDPAAKQRVLDIAFDYNKRSGTTLVIVTHDHELLPRFQRVIDFKKFSATPATAES
jgi:putative ABC transport system ATP-binding protein